MFQKVPGGITNKSTGVVVGTVATIRTLLSKFSNIHVPLYVQTSVETRVIFDLSFFQMCLVQNTETEKFFYADYSHVSSSIW